MVSCQKCESERILLVSGKVSDMCYASFGEAEHNGYVPCGVGVDDGEDYLQVSVCLECGQVQGEWPRPDPGFASKDQGDDDGE